MGDVLRGKPLRNDIFVHQERFIAINDMHKHWLFRGHSHEDIFRVIDADKGRFEWKKDHRGITFARATRSFSAAMERAAARSKKTVAAMATVAPGGPAAELATAAAAA